MAILASLPRVLQALRQPANLRLIAAVSCCWAAACLCSAEDAEGLSAPGKPVLEQPKGLAAVHFKEGARGEPAQVGCSDGQREGFADNRAFPNIAGCLGRWTGQMGLRGEATGQACGDDAGACTVPADVCAAGWHVCAKSGKADDLRQRITWQACNKQAGPGKFVAAMSHGQVQEICPPAPTPTTVFPCWGNGVCAEPVCCGDLCEFGMCKDSVWTGQTKISRGTAEGCGNVRSSTNGGVLCCRDEIVKVESTSSDSSGQSSDTIAASSGASATSSGASLTKGTSTAIH